MKIKKPNAAIYFLAYIFLMPFMKIFFRLEIDRKNYKPPKGAFFAVCNHGSFMDFAVTMLSLYPHRFNAVAAQKFFFYKPLHRLLPMMGCIPKNLFDADARAIIGIKQVLQRGDNVLLYPEGRCECDGVYAGIHKATGKLLKKLQKPVVACSIDGAYNCMPFWRKGMRPGRVRIVLSNLFSAEDLQRLTADEINNALDKRLSREEDPPPRRPLRSFSSRKLAEGLQNILYWCPVCGGEFTTQTQGCVIRCTACGFNARVDGEMKLHPDKEYYLSQNETNGCPLPSTVHEWYKAQAQYEARKLTEDMEPAVVNVRVRLPSPVPGGGMDTCGRGVMRMDTEGWHFDGELRGGQVSLFFPFSIVPALPIDPDDVFQIYAHGTFYCFVPERPRECIKYSVIGECAYWKFSKRADGSSDVKMTPRRDSGFC